MDLPFCTYDTKMSLPTMDRKWTMRNFKGYVSLYKVILPYCISLKVFYMYCTFFSKNVFSLTSANCFILNNPLHFDIWHSKTYVKILLFMLRGKSGSMSCEKSLIFYFFSAASLKVKPQCMFTFLYTSKVVNICQIYFVMLCTFLLK